MPKDTGVVKLREDKYFALKLILLTWRIWLASNNASSWHM